MKSQGFTLIEVIIVIAIMGILTVVVLVRPPDRSVTLAAQTAQVIKDIRSVQNLAMSRGERYRIVFGTTSYRILNESGTVIPNPATGLWDQALAAGFVFSATTLSNRTLVYDPRGIPYEGNASVPLTSHRTITVSAGGGGGCSPSGGQGQKVITITRRTGYVY